MARVTLTFDLDNERAELFDALYGTDYKIIVDHVDEYCRARLKYAGHSEATREVLLDIRKTIEEDREGLPK